MGATILEYLGWFFLTVVKFLITPSTMIGLGYSWLGTIATVFISAFIGFNCFFYFGEVMFNFIAKHRKKPARRFTFMNRAIAKMRMRYGMVGIGFIAGLISVPIAGILASRYFRNERGTLTAFSLSFFFWTLILTSLSWIIKYIFHGHI